MQADPWVAFESSDSDGMGEAGPAGVLGRVLPPQRVAGAKALGWEQTAGGNGQRATVRTWALGRGVTWCD